jgi:pimeloyl-ACP methyl ester carboxylesterase
LKNTVAKVAHYGVEVYVNKFYKDNGMHRRIAEFRDNIIEYWDTESDLPPFLLVHGFGAEAKYQWYLQVSLLSKKFRLIMPNLLYFGNSKNTSGKYTVYDQVEMLKGFLGHLNVSSTKLLGASYGGLIGIELATQTKLVNELFLMGAPIKFMYEADTERVSKMFEIDEVHELFVPSNPVQLKKLIHASSGKPSWIPSFFLTPFQEQFYEGTREEKKQLLEQLLAIRDEFSEKDYRTDIPVHLIWGTNDPIVPLDRAEMLREHIGDSCTIDIIKDGGHMANMVKPKPFNRLLKKYL